MKSFIQTLFLLMGYTLIFSLLIHPFWYIGFSKILSISLCLGLLMKGDE